MSSPNPANPPLTLAGCASWAQADELPSDVRDCQPDDTWCTILALASDVLWAASGRRWRNVQATETVTLDEPECVELPLAGYGWSGYGTRYGYGAWPMLYQRSRPHVIRLPRPDVTAVTTVTIDGAVFTSWRLRGSWLRRTDHQPWPLGPDHTRIAYTFGKLAPPAGRLAAVTFAAELGKAFAGKACSLPARVQSITRQGISVAVLDDMKFLDEGLVGVASVDAWIRSVNPHKTKQAAQVWSPDLVEARTV